MRVAVVSTALLLVACGASTSVSAPYGIAELRRRADSSPNLPSAQRELAIAEMLGDQGDLRRAGPRLRRALELDKRDLRLQFLAAIERDLHGDPDQALDKYLGVIRSAGGSRDAAAPHMAEIAARIVQSLSGRVKNYPKRVQETLRPLLDRGSGLAAPARFAVGELLINLAYGRGDTTEVKRIARSLGCVGEWRAAGPFGPRVLLGFDRDQSVNPGVALRDSYDLGSNRGVRPTGWFEAKGCTAHLGGGAIDAGGTSYAQTTLQVPRDGEYLIRLATPNSVEVFLDGRSVRRIDRRKYQAGPETYFPLTLKAGPRLITVKLSTRSYNPILILAWSPLGPRDRAAIGLPFEMDRPRAGSEGDFARYLRVSTALARGDVMAGREIYRAAGESLDVSPIALIQRGAVALTDPLLPSEVRKDDARRLFEAASRKDNGLWSPILQLAKIEADNGRVTEAIERLREAVNRWPGVISLYTGLIELLRQRGWHTEADKLVKALREKLPDSCLTLEAELAVAERLRNASEAFGIAERLVSCDARSNAKYSQLVEQCRWAEARAELERLASLEPPHEVYGVLLARLELSKNQGDEKGVTDALAELRRRYPRSQTALVEEIDRIYSQGRVEQARQALDEAFRQEPAATLAVRRLERVIKGSDPLTAYRVDGAQIIRQFETSGRSYDQPQVLVFDYMVVRVFEDGSSLQLIHNINKIQSAEAVNELGEFQVPDGARLLKLQTIKSDGRRLEPDRVSGKDSISLPNLVPGDYVEFEYVRAIDPPDAYPGGYFGDRFYFRSFEIPFDTSHMIVIVPRDMPVTVDPRDDAPPLEEKIEGDLRIMSWKVQASRPMVSEPLSVAAREFTPSINIGVGATWDRLVDGLRDVLIDRDVYDPAMQELAKQIVGETSASDQVLRAKRLYAWVTANVENNNDAFSQAAEMLRARAGNRARVLHYLLQLAGVPSRLALVRSAWDDSTPSDLAEPDLYDNLLLRIEPDSKAGRKSPIWLSTTDRWAPFGFIPSLFRGQPALLLEEGAPQARVRQSLDAEDRRKVELRVQLRPDGSAGVEAVEQFWGEGAVAWRQRLEGIAAAELERRFEQEYLTPLVPGAVLNSLRISGRDNPDLPLQFQYRFEVGALGRRVGESWALPALWPTRFAATYAQSSKRNTTELIAPAMDRDLTAYIRLPSGSSLTQAPDRVVLLGPKGGRFNQSYRRDRDALVMEQSVRLPLARIEPAVYGEFARFCGEADTAQARELLIKLPGSLQRSRADK